MNKRIIALSLVLCLITSYTYGADSGNDADKEEELQKAKLVSMIVHLCDAFKAVTGIDDEDIKKGKEWAQQEHGISFSEQHIKYAKSDYDAALEQMYRLMRERQACARLALMFAGEKETDDECIEQKAKQEAIVRNQEIIWQHLSKYKSKDDWRGFFAENALNNKANALLASVIMQETKSTVTGKIYTDILPETGRSKELYQLMKQFDEMPFSCGPDESKVSVTFSFPLRIRTPESSLSD